MIIFLLTHPVHLEFRYSIHGWLCGGDSMIELIVTTTYRLQDLFDKNHPISFESTYIRAHKIPLFVHFWPVLQNLVACRGFKTMPLFNCLFISLQRWWLSSSMQVAPKEQVHCIQTNLQCRKSSYWAIFIEWDVLFASLPETRVQDFQVPKHITLVLVPI